MKIVISERHGGFGLSRVAMVRLIEAKSPVIKILTADQYFGSRSDDGRDVGTLGSDGYSANRFPDGVLFKEGSVFMDNRDYAGRNDPELIAVVEEMGADASGQLARLVVIEIPDDVDWTIDEYDGFEWVAERHRTWPDQS